MLVKFPTRSRPRLFKETFRLYLKDETASFLVTLDADDETMNNPQMLAWLNKQPRTTVRVGNSRSKVEAVNDGLNEIPWTGICLVASDDMVPQRRDYAQRITALFEEFFPDGDGVLHLNDGRTGDKLNTLPICDRKYYDRFGYIYSPFYKSLWCDNEWQEMSERLGRAIYVNECIIAHDWIGDLHPDQLHRHNESFDAVDAQTYRHRLAAGFPN